MKTLNAIDYSFVALYMVTIIFTGVYLSRFVKRTQDYFIQEF